MWDTHHFRCVPNIFKWQMLPIYVSCLALLTICCHEYLNKQTTQFKIKYQYLALMILLTFILKQNNIQLVTASNGINTIPTYNTIFRVCLIYNWQIMIWSNSKVFFFFFTSAWFLRLKIILKYNSTRFC